MKPESRKSSKKKESASCYDLTKLSDALNTASAADTNGGNNMEAEGGSLYDCTKISEALNVAENERSCRYYDFTKISEALNVAENERSCRYYDYTKLSERSRILKARKEMLFKKQEGLLLCLSALDLMIGNEPEFHESDSKQSMQSSGVTRTPLLFRLQRRRIRFVM